MEIFYNFWKELETIYEYEVHENEKIPEISQDNRLIISSYFWKEIQSVYEDICEPSNEDFQQMEKSIIRIKERAFSLVRREFKQHPNNPLFLKFSLFEPMGRGQDEVHYTKTLAWFMDKNQNHGFDSEILKSLWSLFNYENNGSFEQNDC